jgi:hypothetical protein
MVGGSIRMTGTGAELLARPDIREVFLGIRSDEHPEIARHTV